MELPCPEVFFGKVRRKGARLSGSYNEALPIGMERQWAHGKRGGAHCLCMAATHRACVAFWDISPSRW